jgi:hypothetical protein
MEVLNRMLHDNLYVTCVHHMYPSHVFITCIHPSITIVHTVLSIKAHDKETPKQRYWTRACFVLGVTLVTA